MPCTLVKYAGKSIHLGRKQTMATYSVTDKILISFEEGQSDSILLDNQEPFYNFHLLGRQI
jgi:glycogen debranching enzyme